MAASNCVALALGRNRPDRVPELGAVFGFVLRQVMHNPRRRNVVLGQAAQPVKVLFGHRPEALEQQSPDNREPGQVLVQGFADDDREDAGLVAVFGGKQAHQFSG